MTAQGAIVTLKKFWLDQYSDATGQPTISLRTLERLACAKTLPGAHKVEGSRLWFVNMVTWASTQGIEEPIHLTIGEAEPNGSKIIKQLPQRQRKNTYDFDSEIPPRLKLNRN